MEKDSIFLAGDPNFVTMKFLLVEFHFINPAKFLDLALWMSQEFNGVSMVSVFLELPYLFRHHAVASFPWLVWALLESLAGMIQYR